MNVLIQGKRSHQPRVKLLWVIPKRRTSGKREEGLGPSTVGRAAGEPSRFYLGVAWRPGRGDGCVTVFRGLFVVQCFPLSHLSEAKLCPWVVPKANRQRAGHSALALTV